MDEENGEVANTEQDDDHSDSAGTPVDDLDGISSSNIITGKRRRRQTQFYEQTVFNTKEYRNMMLCDVPQEEMHAIEEDDDDDSEEDEEDDDYDEGEEDDEEEGEEEEDEGEEMSEEELKAKKISKSVDISGDQKSGDDSVRSK
jgi:hypothetical protein